MTKRRVKRVTRRVVVTTVVDVDFDPAIMPDDDWREHFYRDITDHDRLAEHLAYNYVVNGTYLLSQLDGFADREDGQAMFRLLGTEVSIE